MDAAKLFCELIAQRRKSCAGDYVNNPTYHQLTKAGLIQETGVVQSVCCDDCDRPHDAAVIYEGSHYGIFCPDIGFVKKSRSELVAVLPNIATFIENLANDLNCKRRKSTPIAGNTSRIGSVETHTGDIAIYFHPVLQNADDVQNLRSALEMEVKARFGLILTAAGSLSIVPYQTVSLQDCISFDPIGNQFRFDADIETMAGIPQMNTGGRPNIYKAKIQKIMIARKCEGRSLEGRNQEVKGILKEYKAKFPNQIAPSISTINNYFSDT